MNDLNPTILALLNPIEERSNANGGVERWQRSAVLEMRTTDLSAIGPKVLHQRWVNVDNGEVEWREVK